MESKISFKIKHKKIEILSNSRVIDTLTINEFNNLCSELEIFKANNPALFENTLDVISTDFLNYEKFGDNMSIGDDFLKGLLAINIRALYFYKKGYTYLFYDFIYKSENTSDNQGNTYGIRDYNIITGDAISVGVENHDKQLIKTGYITNAYIKGHLDIELRKILKNLPNLKIMINGKNIDNVEFWNDGALIEYDSLLLSNT